MKRIRVLLVSPVRELDVYCGDVVYTEALLGNAPENIEYVDYGVALKSKEIIERKRVRNLLKKQNKKYFFIDVIPAFLIMIINFLRRRNILIANPWKYLEVIGSFDLIHVHVFPVSFSGMVPPVLISNAGLSKDFLIFVKKFSRFRARITEQLEALLCFLFNMQETSIRFDKAKKIMVFSEKLRSLYLNRGADPKKVQVIPIGINSPKEKSIDKSNIQEVVIGFIAKDFEAKGGLYLLEAYKQLKKELDNIKLVIVGSDPILSELEMKEFNIDWQGLIPRSEVKKIIGNFDIFAYPTLADGFPLVVLEALSLGVPVLVSDFFALPEMIGYGEVGEVTSLRDVESIKQALNKMLDPAYLFVMKKKAKTFFKDNYDINIVNKKLEKIYGECINSND
jgi:glycosyltransferase involved in cell wall biosynthesis